MMTEQEIKDAITALTQELVSTRDQLTDAIAAGDPAGLVNDLDNDTMHLEEEIEGLEYDLWVVRGRP